MLNNILFAMTDFLFCRRRKIKTTILPFLLAFSLFGLSLSACSTWEPEPVKRANIRAYTQLSHLPPDYPTKHVPDGSVWHDFSSDMALSPNLDKPSVRAQVKWWMRQQNFLNSVLTRGGQYFYHIYQQTKRRNLPSELALLPVFESGYVPVTRSPKSAVGLWQFLRGTAKGYGVRMDKSFDGRHDVVSSTNGALKYLTYLYYFFDKDWLLAIAAYNCGEGRVQAEILKNRRRGLRTDFWSLQTLPRATREYVPRLLALAAVIKNQQKYGVALVPINNAPYFEEVRLSKQIALSKVAKLSGASEWSIKMLNAGYVRGMTDSDGPSVVLVPKSKAAVFKARLEGKAVVEEPIIVEPGVSAVAVEKASERLDKNGVGAVKKSDSDSGKKNQASGGSDDEGKSAKKLGDKAEKDSDKKKDGREETGDEDALNNSENSATSNSRRKDDVAEQVVKEVSAKPKMKKHVVKESENLFSIARKYKTTTAALRRLNKLTSNKVRKYQVLVVAIEMVRERDTESELVVVKARDKNNKSDKNNKNDKDDKNDRNKKKVITNASEIDSDGGSNGNSNSRDNGDDVVAKTVAVKVAKAEKAPDAAAEVVNADDADDLPDMAAPSQERDDAVVQPVTAVKAVKSSHGNSSDYTVPYRVAKGDTVFSIARRFNVTAQQIREANGLHNNSVNIGRTLKIPMVGAATGAEHDRHSSVSARSSVKSTHGIAKSAKTKYSNSDSVARSTRVNAKAIRTKKPASPLSSSSLSTSVSTSASAAASSSVRSHAKTVSHPKTKKPGAVNHQSRKNKAKAAASGQ
jgi:LysM repeat protein/soluble lytic murein transglycosylase-like protein